MTMTNENIAQRLLEEATTFDVEGRNLYRKRAYRQAAFLIQGLSKPLAELYQEGGRDALAALPSVGANLAEHLESLLTTGEFAPRPEDEAEPGEALTSLPGIGRRTARRMMEALDVHSLEDVEEAARTGKLAEVGVGPKRLRGILDALAVRALQSDLVPPAPDEPSVAELLSLDADYRSRIESNQRWKWVGRSEVGPWDCSVSFADTAIAHRLRRTRDWVVIQFDDGHHHSERTIVTEVRGDLCGKRVVRGREEECRAYYSQQETDLPERTEVLASA
jgi:DNA polymerase/3'-5' exonuclease PolX